MLSGTTERKRALYSPVVINNPLYLQVIKEISVFV